MVVTPCRKICPDHLHSLEAIHETDAFADILTPRNEQFRSTEISQSIKVVCFSSILGTRQLVTNLKRVRSARI